MSIRETKILHLKSVINLISLKRSI